MTISTINVQNLERHYASTDQLQKVIAIADAQLKGTFYDLRELRIFNMKAKRKQYNAGTRDNFTVFMNATPNERTAGDKPRDIAVYPTMFGIEVAHGTRLPEYTGGDEQTLVTPEGEILGVYIPDKHELYIYHDVQQYPEEKTLALLEKIFNHIRVEVLDKKGMENSWIHSSNKDAILKKFKERIERTNTQNLEKDKRRLRELEENVQEYQRSLKNGYDNIRRLVTTISSVETGQSDVQEKLIKEMNNIASHPRVTDLRIEGDFITVSVPDIIATDKNDVQYQIGSFQVKINMANSDVRFFGDNPRQGFWTPEDPHPHVNGANGTACLGNVGATIAELCSQNEIYALVMTAIDFLENANIDDGAGKRVVNWDRVNPDGTVDTTPVQICERCEEHTTGQIFTVVTDLDGDGDPDAHGEWCEECRNEYATTVDDGVIVADGILEEYRGEE